MRLAIIGGGAAARILYLPALRRTLGVAEVRCVVDPSAASLSQLAGLADASCIRRCSFEDFLASGAVGDLDAAVVALPHHLHEPAVCQCLQAGLHVLCEKPLTLGSESLTRMAESARRAGRVLAVCQPRRRFPAAIAIRWAIRQGLLGACRRIVWREGCAYGWPAESLSQLRREHGGEVLYDIGAHAFDLLSWWLGDLEVTDYADDARGGAAATVRVGLTGATCPRVEVALSRLYDLGNTVTVEFAAGKVVWSLRDYTAVQVAGNGFPLGLCRVGVGPEKFDFLDAVLGELEQFSRLVHGAGSASVLPDDAARYVRLFDQCRAWQQGDEAGDRGRKGLDGAGYWGAVPGDVSGDPSYGLAVRPSTERRSIAITGASGFIGGRLAELADEAGYDVRALAHRPKSCARLARRLLDLRLVDLRDAATLKDAFVGCDVVYHGAYGSADNQAIRETILRGTQNVLQAACDAGVSTVVVLGSMLGYGDPPPTGTVAEDSGFRPPCDDYGRAKHRMALEAVRFAQEHPLRVIVLEPTCVFGPFGRDFVTAYLDQIRRGSFSLLEGGRGRANLIYVDNLARAMLTAGRCETLASGRYLVNEDEVQLTWGEYFESLWTLFDGYQPPLVTRQDIARERERRRRENRPLQLLRQAVRRDRPAREMIARQPWFGLWQRVRGAVGGARLMHAAVRTPGVGPVAAASGDSAVSPLAGFLPSETFLALFDSQAVYSSARFRQATGWRPEIPFADAMRHTCDWAANVVSAASVATDRLFAY